MEQIYFGRFNQPAYEAFSASELSKQLVEAIGAFRNLTRTTSAEEAMVIDSLTDSAIPKIAFALYTSETTITIQSLIGLIATVMQSGDKSEPIVLKCHQVASELIIYLSNMIESPYSFLEAYTTLNGHLKIRNLVSNKDNIAKTYYPLPLNTPAKDNGTLGSYEWESTETRAVEKLNKTAFTVLQIPEVEPYQHLNLELRQREELWIKWSIRQQMIPQYKGRTFHFRWSQCYRGRMYPEGKMLAFAA